MNTHRLLSVALILSLLVTPACSAPQPVGDGGVSTPSSWVSTSRTVVNVLAWALPAADAIVTTIVPPPADAAVHLAFRIAEGSLAALQRALATYQTTATAGAMCDARAAVDGCAVALIGVADALRATGYGLAPEIESAVQALAAVADEIAPACTTDAGLPPSHAAAVRVAVSPAGALRPFPPLPRPVAQ